MIRPSPSIEPVAICGLLVGRRIRQVVDALVLPTAYEASRTCWGMALRPSRVEPTISGRATTESIAAQAKKERPTTTPELDWLRKPMKVEPKRIVPKRARTTEGTPAIISIVDSHTRASAVGRPYSVSHTATATPTGIAIAEAITARIKVPIRALENPPEPCSVKPLAFGGVVSCARFTYLIPWMKR